MGKVADRGNERSFSVGAQRSSRSTPTRAADAKVLLQSSKVQHIITATMAARTADCLKSSPKGLSRRMAAARAAVIAAAASLFTFALTVTTPLENVFKFFLTGFDIIII